MKNKISFHIDKVTYLYLLPTIQILPNLVIWDDDIPGWSKEYKAINIDFEFLMFEVGISITYKVKKGK